MWQFANTRPTHRVQWRALGELNEGRVRAITSLASYRNDPRNEGQLFQNGKLLTLSDQLLYTKMEPRNNQVQRPRPTSERNNGREYIR